MGVIYIGCLLVVAAVVGMLAQFITGYSRGGCPVSFIVAFFGAMVGPAAARELGFVEPLFVPLGPTSFPLVTSAVTAFVLVLIINLLTKRRKF
jgi:uncharacterized membrane protein YeaQ/YmgE (transglycosylase-associated protein family)